MFQVSLSKEPSLGNPMRPKTGPNSPFGLQVSLYYRLGLGSYNHEAGWHKQGRRMSLLGGSQNAVTLLAVSLTGLLWITPIVIRVLSPAAGSGKLPYPSQIMG